MKKALIAAAALIVLSAPALAQTSSGGQNAGLPTVGQIRADAAPTAYTGSTGTKKEKSAKGRKRKMNSNSGN